jgi:hypothetical protein
MPDSDENGRPGPPVAGDDTDTLVGSIERERAIFAWKSVGLDAARLRATAAASSVKLGGLLKHLALVEDDTFPDESVHGLPDEVGMAVVPRVLLDHVDHDAPQAGCLTTDAGVRAQRVQAAVGQRLRDRGAGHSFLPERVEPPSPRAGEVMERAAHPLARATPHD